MRKTCIYTLAVLALLAFTAPLLAAGERYILFEDFEGITPPAWPAGWAVEDSNGDMQQWESRSAGGARGGQCARYLSHAANPADDWFFSPAVTLTAGTVYTVGFESRVTSALSPHNLNVWMGNGQTSGNMTAQLLALVGITNTEMSSTTLTFSFVSSGDYYLGMHCDSGPNNLALFVDDILLSTAETDLELHFQLSKAFYQGSNTYSVGEPIQCLAYVKNVGSSALTVNGQLALGHTTDPDAVLSFIVKDPNGQTVPLRAKYKMSIPEEEDFTSLAPGESVYKYYDLNSGAFDFSTPGTYTVQAVYQNLFKSESVTVWLGKLTSDELTLNIQ